MWLLLFAFLFLYALITDFQCVFLRFFHVICPGCGMMRSIKSLLRFDLKGAFQYHPMVFAMPLVVLYILLDGHVFRNRTVNILVISLIGAGFLVNYIVRLWQFTA